MKVKGLRFLGAVVGVALIILSVALQTSSVMKWSLQH